MEEKLRNQLILPGLGPPEHPFSDEEEKENERERTEQLRPILNELDRWRAESIYGPNIPVFYAA